MAVTIRRCVQVVFLLLVILIGIKFYLFVSRLEAGILPGFDRPPGVEAFLPISALISLKYLFFTGTFNSVHPSALVLFLIISSTALIAKKGFCSWVCPFGILSEYLSKLHLTVFKNGLVIPQWIDVLLRSIKYFIAGFFLYIIFFKMPVSSIEQFIYSPYNRFSDIKMLQLFTDISKTTLTVLLILLILSVFIRNMWCRYLCPYGALLGIIGVMSIGTIKRNSSYCTDCGKCEKKCPGLIKVRQKERVYSPECSACLACVDSCPEKRAIGFSLLSGRLQVRPHIMAVIFIMMFFVGISMAKVSGHWQNSISKQEYLDSFVRSNVPRRVRGDIDPEKLLKMMQLIKAQRAQLNKSLKE